MAAIKLALVFLLVAVVNSESIFEYLQKEYPAKPENGIKATRASILGSSNVSSEDEQEILAALQYIYDNIDGSLLRLQIIYNVLERKYPNLHNNVIDYEYYWFYYEYYYRVSVNSDSLLLYGAGTLLG